MTVLREIAVEFDVLRSGLGGMTPTTDSTLEDFVNLKTNWRTLRRFSDDLIEKGEIKLFWPIEEKRG